MHNGSFTLSSCAVSTYLVIWRSKLSRNSHFFISTLFCFFPYCVPPSFVPFSIWKPTFLSWIWNLNFKELNLQSWQARKLYKILYFSKYGRIYTWGPWSYPTRKWICLNREARASITAVKSGSFVSVSATLIQCDKSATIVRLNSSSNNFRPLPSLKWI